MHKQLCSARAVRMPTASRRFAQDVERRDPEVTAGFFFLVERTSNITEVNVGVKNADWG